MKYNALRIGAESISIFTLIPEHVVTVVLENISLNAGTFAVLGTWCVVFQHIDGRKSKTFCDFKFLYFLVTFLFFSIVLLSAPSSFTISL
jgi:hypothetical protein